MPLDGLDRAAQLATQNPYYNPRPIEYAAIRQLLDEAYRGQRPGTPFRGAETQRRDLN